MPSRKARWPLPFRPDDADGAPDEQDPEERRRVELEAELHGLDAEIGRMREQMLLLRGLERTAERQARIDALAARYEELSARFVALYRAWNRLG